MEEIGRAVHAAGRDGPATLASIEGKLKEQLRETDIDELDVEEGVEVLMDKIIDLTGDQEMVELGDDMDNSSTRRGDAWVSP